MAWTEATSRSMLTACFPGHLKELPKGMIKKLISALSGIDCRPMMRTIARERSSSPPSYHSWELLLVFFSWLLWNESGITIVTEYKLYESYFYFSVIGLVYLVFFASPERSREILDNVQATYHRALQQTHLEGSSWWNQIRNFWRN